MFVEMIRCCLGNSRNSLLFGEMIIEQIVGIMRSKQNDVGKGQEASLPQAHPIPPAPPVLKSSSEERASQNISENQSIAHCPPPLTPPSHAPISFPSSLRVFLRPASPSGCNNIVPCTHTQHRNSLIFWWDSLHRFLDSD